MEQKCEKYFNISYCKKLYEDAPKIIKNVNGKEKIIKDLTLPKNYMVIFFIVLKTIECINIIISNSRCINF